MNRRTPSPPPPHRGSNRRTSRGGFTRQQVLILVLAGLLGIAWLVVAAVFVFSAGPAAPTGQPVAQLSPQLPQPTAAAATQPNQPIANPTEPFLQGCSPIPGEALQGTTTHVQDAATLQVIIEGNTTPVGFAGIVVPLSGPAAELALQKVREWLEGQPVMMIKDVSGQDPQGRQLYYVVAGGQLINAELVRQGMAQVIPGAPDQACSALLREAEQQARAGKIGLWVPSPVPTRTFVPFVTLDPAKQSACSCSARPECSDFSSHKEAQECYNACNDYNSRLDNDHDGIACEELP